MATSAQPISENPQPTNPHTVTIETTGKGAAAASFSSYSAPLLGGVAAAVVLVIIVIVLVVRMQRQQQNDEKPPVGHPRFGRNETLHTTDLPLSG